MDLTGDLIAKTFRYCSKTNLIIDISRDPMAKKKIIATKMQISCNKCFYDANPQNMWWKNKESLFHRSASSSDGHHGFPPLDFGGAVEDEETVPYSSLRACSSQCPCRACFVLRCMILFQNPSESNTNLNETWVKVWTSNRSLKLEWIFRET
jgi:hypothetical protein